jgi:hypothetical protein
VAGKSSRAEEKITDAWGSCPSILRLILATGKPGKIPSFLHLSEGVLPSSTISFSPRWCCLPWCGCASCSSGRGQVTVPLLTRRHLARHSHGASAATSRNPLWASPPSRLVTHVHTRVTPAHTPLQPHPHASSCRGHAHTPVIFFPPPGTFFPLRVTYLGEKRQQALERRWHSGGARCGACHMTWKTHRHLANQSNGLAGEKHATGQKVRSQIYSPSSHA